MVAQWRNVEAPRFKSSFGEAGEYFNKALSGATKIADELAARDYKSAEDSLNAELALAKSPEDVALVRERIMNQATPGGEYLNAGAALQSANSRDKAIQTDDINDLKFQKERIELQRDLDQEKRKPIIEEMLPKYVDKDDNGNITGVRLNELLDDPALKGMNLEERLQVSGDIISSIESQNSLGTTLNEGKLARDNKILQKIVKKYYKADDKTEDFGIKSIISEAYKQGIDQTLIDQIVPSLASTGMTSDKIEDTRLNISENRRKAEQTDLYRDAVNKATNPETNEIDLDTLLKTGKGVDNILQRYYNEQQDKFNVKNQTATQKAAMEKARVDSIKQPFTAMKDIIKGRYKEDPESGAEAQFALLRLEDAFTNPKNAAHLEKFVKQGHMDTLYRAMQKATGDQFVFDEVFGSFDPEALDSLNTILASWDIDDVPKNPTYKSSTGNATKDAEQDALQARFEKEHGKLSTPGTVAYDKGNANLTKKTAAFFDYLYQLGHILTRKSEANKARIDAEAEKARLNRASGL